MKNIIKYALAATVCSVMLSSCDLNILPNSAIAYDENGQLIQTTSNLTSLENGMLASFRSYQRGTYVLSPELQFDLFNASVDYGNNYGSLHKSDYNFNSGTYEPGYMWQQGYSVIKNCNIIIAAADNVPDEIAAATQIVKGEAYFFRAASYLQLARQFGKHASKAADTDLCVPLVLVFNTSERPARATVKEVYAQIKQDLTDAASLLAGVNGAPLSYRPTIDAVNALFARYYLDMGDYTNAAAYAHKVIDTGKYELASTVEEMEDVYIYDKGTEAIMQCFASIAEGPNGLNEWTLCQSDATYGQCLRPYYLPTQTVIDLYEESDLRFQTWYDNTEYVFINGNYFKGEFYTFVKYWGNPLLTSSPIRNGLNAAKPLKIGEMYLIAAEAELAGNNTAAAKADLNTLQTKRGASATDATAAKIHDEWVKETIGEGQRKICLKRWGLGFSGREMQPGAANVLQQGDVFNNKVWEANSYLFQWPVPAYEKKINSNLVQNPGYSD